MSYHGTLRPGDEDYQPYFHGKPCLKGHGTLRATANGSCVECLREKRRARDRVKYAIDPMVFKERNRSYHQLHRDQRDQSNMRWREAHPDKWVVIKRETKRRRVSRLRGATGSYTLEELGALALVQPACVYCGSGNGLTWDHILPIIRGGTDTIDNLQRACRSCNSSKGSKTHEEFLVFRLRSL